MIAPAMPTLRIKLGRNPYANRFTCSYCRTEFERGGMYVRLEQHEIVIDLPICAACFDSGKLFETLITFDGHDASHPLGLA